MQYVFGYAEVKLSDICESIKDGMHNLPSSSEEGEYPILSAQNINDGKIDYLAKRYVTKDVFEKENKRTNVSINDVLLTIVATIGRTAVVKDNRRVLLQRSVCVLKPNELVDSMFLRYCLDTNKVQNYMHINARGSAQAGLYLNQVSEIVIALPSTEKQKDVARVLKKFEKLCYDISAGIPAEIEARQKQYEYYRDKLLSFEKEK